MQRIPLEVRHDAIRELTGRSALVLESPVGLRAADRAAAEVAAQLLQEPKVLLVQRKCERGTDLEPGSEGRPDGEGHTEASLAFRKTRNEPRIELAASIGTRYCSEGRRVVGAIDLRLRRRTSHLSFRISR